MLIATVQGGPVLIGVLVTQVIIFVGAPLRSANRLDEAR